VLSPHPVLNLHHYLTGYKTSLIDRTSKGYLVVETNYRIIGYTNSQLQIAMLGLFSQLHYKFPNMVVGTITRESTHQALIHGITAEQVMILQLSSLI
jgi:transcription initiation factor TFIIH subunit 4